MLLIAKETVMEIVQSFSLWFLYVHVVVWGYGWCVSKVEMCNNFKVYCNCGAVFIWMMGSGIGRVVKWEEQGAPHQCQVCKSSQSYPKQYPAIVNNVDQSVPTQKRTAHLSPKMPLLLYAFCTQYVMTT